MCRIMQVLFRVSAAALQPSPLGKALLSQMPQQQKSHLCDAQHEEHLKNKDLMFDTEFHFQIMSQK